MLLVGFASRGVPQPHGVGFGLLQVTPSLLAVPRVTATVH